MARYGITSSCQSAATSENKFFASSHESGTCKQRHSKQQTFIFFTRESSCCFQRDLAIAILFVRLSVCPSDRHTGGLVKNGAS